ncbi:hypothetical protein MKW92_048666 [Papaver armeniacum]|nr:hypothetical protein MKW92_048666 [Papaver armeniacum]
MACNISNSFTDWDLHNFGVLNADSNNSIMSSSSSSSMVMEDSSSFLSTGYLEDAVMEWSNYCKKQRLSSYNSSDYDAHQILHSSKQQNVNMDYGDNGAMCFQNLMCSSSTPENNLMAENKIEVQDDKPLSSNSSLGNDILSGSSKGQIKSMKTEQLDRKEMISPLSTSYLDSVTKDLEDKHSSSSRPKRTAGNRGRKVAYPFNVVKPGGIEGDVTLSDINNRLLMPPTRPIKHPVGDMACLPVCVSTGGPGLSGKAVVAFTRIHTQGRGTVTIIRTKG